MPTAHHDWVAALAAAWAELWQPPELQARSFGRSGELLAARVRIATVLLLIGIPLKSVLLAPSLVDNWIGLSVALIALLLGLGILRLAARPEPPGWLGLASCVIDVSLVSLGNVGFLLAGHPLTATNSNVHFTVFMLSNVPARFGGEEFAILLRDAGPALARLERLRADQAAAQLELPDGTQLRFTISLGVAAFPEDGGAPGDLLACADRRLYEAKRQGRNRVVASG